MNNRYFAKTVASLVMVVALLSVARIASATIIGAGTAPTPPDVFGFAPGGTLRADTGLLPYSTSVFSGTYESRVFSDPLNPLCADCLGFVYFFTVAPTAIDPIHRATVADFNGFMTDVGYSSAAAGVPPDTVDRSLNGRTVGFNFPVLEGVMPGMQSRLLVVYTDATNFAPGTLALIDSQSVNLQGYQPSEIPEPGTLLLLGSGLLAGLVGARFTRTRRA